MNQKVTHLNGHTDYEDPSHLFDIFLINQRGLTRLDLQYAAGWSSLNHYIIHKQASVIDPDQDLDEVDPNELIHH